MVANSQSLAGRYASALYELADQGRALDAISDDLVNFRQLMVDSEDLNRLIRSPVVSRADQNNGLMAILEKAINYLEGQLAEKNITIQLSNEARKYLALKGYDVKYGARPLQRIIQKEIKESLAKEILFGKLKNGGLVNISIKNKKIIFTFEK